MFSGEPGTSCGAQADRLDRAGLVGDRVAGCAPARRRACRCGTSAASAPASCRRAAASRRRDRPRLALQRVGDRQRQQAADGIVAAGVDQRLDPFGAHQAARGVVHQHPVVGARAEPGAARAGRRRRSRRASRRRSARSARRGSTGRPAARSKSLVVGRDAPPAIRLSRGTAGKRRQRVARPAAGPRPRRTAWRPARRRGTPLPAHGTSANRRRTLRARVGIGVRDRSRRPEG